MFLHQWLYDRIELTREHVLEFVECQVDTVIGHSALWEVVSSDFGAAIAGADHRTPALGQLCLLFTLLLKLCLDFLVLTTNPLGFFGCIQTC